MSEATQPGTPRVITSSGVPLDRWGEIAIRPTDGFRAEFIDSVDGAFIVYLVFRAGGEVQDKWEVVRYSYELNQHSTNRAYASAQRATLLLDAMGRFLNTGGDLTDFHCIMASVRALARQGKIGQLSFGDGFELLSTTILGQISHWMSDRSGSSVNWVEDEFVDFIPTEEVLNQLQEEAEDEQGEGEEASEEAEI